jgi:hypothetical protein
MKLQRLGSGGRGGTGNGEVRKIFRDLPLSNLMNDRRAALIFRTKQYLLPYRPLPSIFISKSHYLLPQSSEKQI